MNSLSLAIFAYFINGAVFIIDKYLLQAPIPRPFAYAFWMSLLSIFVIVLLPFGVYWPGMNLFLISVASGAANFCALVFLFQAIRKSNISVAGTKFGSFGIIFTYLLSLIILGKAQVELDIIPLIMFAVGIYFLARVDKNILLLTLIGGFLSGLAFVLLKLVFDQSDFINGIFWTRLGFAVSPLVVFISSRARKEIFESFKSSNNRSKLVFSFNKALAGVGSLALYYAIKLGDVSTVSALSGFQFVFVLLLALSLKGTLGIDEDSSYRILKNKVIGIFLILFGFLFILKQ